MDPLLDFDGFGANIDNVFLPVHRNEDENSLLFAIGYGVESSKKIEESQSLDLLDFSHFVEESEVVSSSLPSSTSSSTSASISLSSDEMDTLLDEPLVDALMNPLSVLDLPFLDDDTSRDALYCKETMAIPNEDDMARLYSADADLQDPPVLSLAPPPRVMTRPSIIPKRKSKWSTGTDHKKMLTNSKDMTTHHSYAKYPCQHTGCAQTFPSIYDLRRHMAAFHPPIRCPQPNCTFSFSSTVELQKHACRHRQLYVCDSCDVTFTNKIVLQNHFNDSVRGKSCVPCYSLSLTELRRRMLERQQGRARAVSDSIMATQSRMRCIIPPEIIVLE